MADPEHIDAFAPIATHYDTIMEHVNYARWLRVASALGEALLEPGFLHLDVGCGTGVLLRMLHHYHAAWNCAGADLSHSMLRVARRREAAPLLVQSDMRRLPFTNVDFITCLFDSINFLLHEEEVIATLHGFSHAMNPGALLYFDVVTERMVRDHFSDEAWTETHSGMHSAWHSRYDRKTGICETRVRVNSGTPSVTRERIYPAAFLEKAVTDSGLSLLAVRDAATWRAPTRRTCRMEFIVVKGDPKPYAQRFSRVDNEIRNHIRE